MRHLFVALSLTALFLPGLVFAGSLEDTAFVPLTSIPGIAQAGNIDTLPEFLNNLYKLAIGAAAVLAVLQIVRAGIVYMGGDSVTEKKEAKQLITYAIGGLVLVLSPVIVFSIINPDILSLKIGRFDELRPVPQATTTNTGLGGGATAPDSVIPATGTRNGACKTYADGEALPPNDYVAQQCCGNQQSATVSCEVRARTNRDYTMTEYCACTQK